jgi:hypothetical protein
MIPTLCSITDMVKSNIIALRGKAKEAKFDFHLLACDDGLSANESITINKIFTFYPSFVVVVAVAKSNMQWYT